MKPYIICHMLSSIDGKINVDALEAVVNEDDYEATAAKLKGDAWICGRTTMQYFAGRQPFVPSSRKPAGPQPVYIAQPAKSYAIAVDTLGKLGWRSNKLGSDHLICIVSERVSADYLAMLRKKRISYIVAGAVTVDLRLAVEQLGKHFAIRTLLLEGGGHINGGFLAAGLIDELSLLLVPGIDGRHDIPAVFDGLNLTQKQAVPLKLKSVTQRKRGTLWLRYKVIHPKKGTGNKRAKTSAKKK